MTDAPDDVERVREYVRLHPDAGVPEILGALGLSPDRRDLVEAVLEGDEPLGNADTNPLRERFRSE